MIGSEADKAAILTAIRGETEAWLQRDFEALASYWVQSPQTRRMEAFASVGIRVDLGWDVIAARLRKIVERFPEKQPFKERVSWENVNVVVMGNMAWVTYDQIGTDTGNDLKRLLKIMHRIEGAWKIACLVMMESTIQQANCALIEVDAEARILWTNSLARGQMPSHGGLVAVAGKLRAANRGRDAALRSAMSLAFQELQSQRPIVVAPKQTWAVSLGEDSNGMPINCWVLLEDGKVLIAFQDSETVARRIAGAQEVYHLSPAQDKLARLIVKATTLAVLRTDLLTVSINTLRTQLQRIFDKTGVRSQAALVRSLLSADAPNK